MPQKPQQQTKPSKTTDKHAARLQLAHRLLDERMAERSVFMGTALLPHPFLSVTKT